MPLRLIIADDYTPLRHALRDKLNNLPDMCVVGEALHGQHALDLVAQLRPDILVTDISMPHLGGIEVTTHLRQQGATLPILILSMHADRALARMALRQGAQGYLLKDALSTELELALRTLSQGGTYLSHRLADVLAD